MSYNPEQERKDIAFIRECIVDRIKSETQDIHGANPTAIQQMDITLKSVLTLLAEIEYRTNKEEYGLWMENTRCLKTLCTMNLR